MSSVCATPSTSEVNELSAKLASKRSQVTQLESDLSSAKSSLSSIEAQKCGVLGFGCRKRRNDSAASVRNRVKSTEAELRAAKSALANVQRDKISAEKDYQEAVSASRNCLSAVGVKGTNPTYRDRSSDSPLIDGSLITQGFSLKSVGFGVGLLIFGVVVIFLIQRAKSAGVGQDVRSYVNDRRSARLSDRASTAPQSDE